MQQETGLFEIRINEQGRKFIRKFARISYTIMGLVIFDSAISIYWHAKLLINRSSESTVSQGAAGIYELIIPYYAIGSSLIALISNFYYLRFPGILLRKIELNDEIGANRAFGILFRAAMIFLVWLLFSTVITVWSFLVY